jgi:hypothetical protein
MTIACRYHCARRSSKLHDGGSREPLTGQTQLTIAEAAASTSGRAAADATEDMDAEVLGNQLRRVFEYGQQLLQGFQTFGVASFTDLLTAPWDGFDIFSPLVDSDARPPSRVAGPSQGVMGTAAHSSANHALLLSTLLD